MSHFEEARAAVEAALTAGAVLGVGRHAVDVPAGLTTVVRAPALHLAEWNYTGGSDG
jgi:hypothetical protein